MADFSVVGGGVAGLVVARRLAASGAAVTVFEASDRLGGTVARHEVGGLALDAGAESFAVRGGAVEALLAELDLAGDIVAPAPGPAWLQPVTGDAVPLPATALLGIPADPLADDVVRVVGLAAAERAVTLDARPVGEVPSMLGPLVRERLGADVLDRLVAPVVHGVHSQHPDLLPVARAHPGLADAVASAGSLSGAVARLRAAAPPGAAVAGIRGGINRLVPALADDLARRGGDIRLGTRVGDLGALDGTVVVAAPGVATPAAPGRRIDLVTLVVEQDELDAAPRGTGLLVAAGAPVGARALTHATAKWEWLREAAEGRHVVRLSYDETPGDPVAAAVADAETLLGVRLPVVVDAAQVFWVRPAAASTVPSGLTVVGETVAGSGLAGIVAHAERTAAELLAR
ncbi:oxygen-dependent protoporphyrinogen oxidase [Microbacterium trichothecenolyticum]|uniref:protoporphyrinogen/coproporphyrinogen oxidase n=1 Tax=Microbacterium trichothecenolyticum TaxID=69370 RepID=UPI0028597DDC|nr:FAD-dependent oxidoreductase [Microbacterium trichothecenolyticum]MDR7186776.1 oxygen-dependent protoporphyrinogen oxidase [Microbacterium trichothecenolyticum]